MSRLAFRLAPLYCTLAVLGCSVLAPQPDRTRFFVLSPVPDPPASTPISDVVVALGPVRFPDYLGRLQIATRTEESRLEFSETELWAEPLDLSFTRVLSQDLVMLTDLDEIVSYPWYSEVKVDYQIPVHVLRFEGDESGDVVLDARWAIKNPETREVLYSTETRIREEAGSADSDAVAMVEAMNEAIGKLAYEIAQQLDNARAQAAPGRRTH